MRSFTNNHPPPKLERVFHSELPIIQLTNSVIPLCKRMTVFLGIDSVPKQPPISNLLKTTDH